MRQIKDAASTSQINEKSCTDGTKNILNAIFSGECSSFVEEYWPEKFCCSHDNGTILEPLLSDELLSDISSISEKLVLGRHVSYSRTSQKNSYQSLLLNKNALASYNKGETISLENVDLVVPSVLKFALNLNKALSLATPLKGVALIASPKGNGVPLHHDGIELFIVHISGRKRWFVSKNESKGVIATYFSNSGGQSIREGAGPHPYKDLYKNNEIREPLANEEREIILKPGSCMFIPKGMWHRTIADTDCVSLTFKIPAITPRMLIPRLINHAMTKDEFWCESIDLESEDSSSRIQAKLDQLFFSMKGSLNEFDNSVYYTKRANSHLTFSEKEKLAIKVSIGKRELTIDISREQLAVIRIIKSLKGEFTYKIVASKLSDEYSQEIDGVLAILERLGHLIRKPPTPLLRGCL